MKTYVTPSDIAIYHFGKFIRSKIIWSVCILGGLIFTYFGAMDGLPGHPMFNKIIIITMLLGGFTFVFLFFQLFIPIFAVLLNITVFNRTGEKVLVLDKGAIIEKGKSGDKTYPFSSFRHLSKTERFISIKTNKKYLLIPNRSFETKAEYSNFFQHLIDEKEKHT